MIATRKECKSEFDVILSSKLCFGMYENWDNSWHCKGCPLKNECESKMEENENETR